MSDQSIAILVNLCVLLFAIAGTFILVWKLKFEDNNSRIIFLLYVVYWVAPLLCRDYTAAIHIHMGLNDGAKLMWIPVATFGAIGIVWRPLNDILTYRTKSRKLIIFISIVIQLLTLLPFLLWPCFETNIIQSIGTGIGASGIGLFTLMFNENQKHRRRFLTVSLFALPPIIASFFVSAIESFISSYMPSGHTPIQYMTTSWYIWLIALIFVLVSFIMVFFVTERRETLYQDKEYKQPVVKASGHWKLILLCICGVGIAFMRWATAGPFSGMQLTFIGNHYQQNTGLWDGYLGLVYSFGGLIGSIISAFFIIKSTTSKYQPIIVACAIFLWIIYIGITCSFVTVPVYFWLNMINGIAFGLIWNVLMQIVLNKFYLNRDIMTPIGWFNMSLSLGIVIGSLFVGLTKYKYFDFHSGQTIPWEDFIQGNYLTSIILLSTCALIMILFGIYYGLHNKTRVRRKLKPKSVAMIGENEI